MIVRVNHDNRLFPFRCPQMERHDMSVEFEVGDTPVRVLAGDRAREVLVGGVVVAAEAWFPLVPSI